MRSRDRTEYQNDGSKNSACCECVGKQSQSHGAICEALGHNAGTHDAREKHRCTDGFGSRTPSGAQLQHERACGSDEQPVISSPFRSSVSS
jgi:hypothetical protein